MHPCFQVSELTSLICAMLIEPNSMIVTFRRQKSFRKDLASLASTCKAFKEPALDALYYELRSLAHLFMCLPPDLWKIEDKVKRADHRGVLDTQKILSFLRAMRRSDWLILEGYARRVHSLDILGGDDIAIDSEVLIMVSIYCGVSLFPQLRHIHISYIARRTGSDSPFSLLAAKLSFGPALSHLHLSNVDSSSLPIILLASQSSPALQSLDLKPVSEARVLMTPFLTEAVHGFRQLRVFDVFLPGDATSQAGLLSALRSLHSLERLSLSVSTRDQMNHTPSPAISLSNLSHFSIRCYARQVEDIMRCFLHLDTVTSFTGIIVGVADISSLDVDQALISLATKLPDTVSSIDLTIPRECKDFESSSLQSLNKFHELKHLTLTMGTLPFHNDHFVLLTFPHLLSLCLHSSERKLSATLQSVGLLLRHYPRLMHLSLAVDAQNIPNAECDTSPLHVCSRTLTSWDVTRSITEDPEFTARHIMSMIPNLCKLTSQNMSKQGALWKRVADLVDFWRVAFRQCHSK
ncbi:hypothetical protein CONPUDRAFT_166500 [Coniophora puteana RWD-64-598 SS2]|uniref:F-box domain-containing protein n=1 Tax=Coniophora puteana (strain RWD-64-598) TaxID=741705 RepID=A0A5M3MLF3_CONPW|nr:uncharacterized protein CONPUDRAFT_166500 [Coniophora puteana RWD-64-598 SS2]EIW79800.1 hypothetical protein CONPUDRAFT_166500 [Coniophora puteana RWD-64-598 SS2]